jgi:N-carbamoyl-L-amino-acid hydrolase
VAVQCLHASAQAPSTLRVNAQRIHEHLSALSKFGANPEGGVSRVAYSDADLQGRNYAISLMKKAGLDVHIDAAGNIVGTRAGSDASLKPLLIGSHLDSVPMGGNYDGDVGSLSAIEVAQTLKEKQIALRHPLEVIILILFPTAAKPSARARTLWAVIRIGLSRRAANQAASPDILNSILSRAEHWNARKTNIGVVEGIVGILHSDVTIEGFANHAGTTPMDQRHDALLSAARLIEKVNQIVTGVPGRQVGTVGWIKVEPGAYNVIPGKVVVGLELRDLDEKKFVGLFEQIRAAAEDLGKLNQTRFSFTDPVISHPALTDKGFQKLIDDTARSLGFSTKVMPSGAGHDAQEIARIGPVGMIFIPSIGGISHSPKEFSRPQDVENGANVLLQTVLAFDKK